VRNGEPDPRQAVQRVRVGLIGLAAVILLIGVAGLIFSTLRRNPAPAGAQNGAAAFADNASTGDPLADLGVAPGVAATDNAQ